MFERRASSFFFFFFVPRKYSFSPVFRSLEKMYVYASVYESVNKVEFINIINRRRRDLASPTESQTLRSYIHVGAIVGNGCNNEHDSLNI